MTDPLRVVIVEDSGDDVALLVQELRRMRDHVAFEWVTDAASLRETLNRGPWDAILCDWTLPLLTAPEALEIVKRAGIDVPFIIVTGTIPEEIAVDAIHAGAHDIVRKDRLSRLLPALGRELRESKIREARRLVERQLRTSEMRYQALFESSPLPMWAFDRETLAFVQVNEAAVLHYGYSREEFASMTLLDIRPAEDGPALLADVARRNGSDAGNIWRHRKKDGSIIVVEIKASDFDLDGRQVRLVLANDITERVRAQDALRAAEEQLREAQKMEAVGRLAGGVAHDFNNLLSVIVGYTELAALDLRAGEPMHDKLSEVMQAAEHAGDLVRHLLAFSRNQILRPQTVNLNDIVARMTRLLACVLGNNVRLVIDTDPRIGTVEIDPVQMEQVLLNLAVNARDAMPKGGKFVIETRCTSPSRHVLLAATDTGSGMSEETLSKVFEPFFTTKEPGKGTGLGLSTVYGIVKQSGGHIKVESKLEHGTRFEVYLPPSAGLATSASIQPHSAHEAVGGTETILLVADDLRTRVHLHSMLKRSGYHVIEAKSSGDALLMCERHAGLIHLLLADVAMPLMSGSELAARLLAVRPELKVLYLAAQGSSHADVRSLHAAVVRRPILRDELLARVREVLDGVA